MRFELSSDGQLQKLTYYFGVLSHILKATVDTVPKPERVEKENQKILTYSPIRVITYMYPGVVVSQALDNKCTFRFGGRGGGRIPGTNTSLPSLPRCVPGIMEAKAQARAQLKEPVNHGQGLTESANQIHAMHGWSWSKNTEPVLIRLGMELTDIKIALNVLTRHTVQPHMRSTQSDCSEYLGIQQEGTQPT